MNTCHISVIRAIRTAFLMIYKGGEQPAFAIRTAFRLRAIVNELYRMGMTPEELSSTLNQHQS